MWIKMKWTTVILVLLAGCSNSTTQSDDFDNSLYSGKPVESLTSELPPKTEAEALTRGDLALSNKNVDLALYEYLRSLTFPKAQYKDRTLYTVGKIHLTKPNADLAERAFLASINENPNNIGSLEELGALYTKSGRSDEGKSYFLKAINADQIRLGAKPVLTHDTLDADKISNLKYDEQSPAVAYNGLGVLLDMQEEHSLAQSLFTRAIEIDPKNVGALISYGYSNYMEGDYIKAALYTKAALQRDGSNKKALNNLALIYLSDGKVRQALNVFNRHLTEPEALNNVGYFLILQGKAEQAIPYLQEAIDKNPSYYEVANENLERALSIVREGHSPDVIVQ